MTIQGKLEKIFTALLGKAAEVHGSGRTDEGVHALEQIANVRLDTQLSPQEITDYVNRYLPEDIAVIKVEEVPERFHSRLNAVSKMYLYQIETDVKKDVFQRKYYYGLGKELDVKQMKKAAAYLLGEHDYKSFCSNRKMKKSTIRTIRSIEIEEKGSRVLFHYRGNGFLQQMVRIMTGTLIEVGLGQRQPESMKDILNAKDRQAAGFTAPAEGLFLERVYYQ